MKLKLIIKSIIFLPFLLVFLLYSGCYWDNEEYLYPKISQCDTSVYTYTAAVKPILDSYCLSCHANNVAPSSGGNVKLGTHADVKTVADNGKLLGSISHQNGFSAMPKGSSKLEDCKITIVRKWITAGALNN
jgi:cytochrome c5